jgi:hypothetical protein
VVLGLTAVARFVGSSAPGAAFVSSSAGAGVAGSEAGASGFKSPPAGAGISVAPGAGSGCVSWALTTTAKRQLKVTAERAVRNPVFLISFTTSETQVQNPPSAGTLCGSPSSGRLRWGFAKAVPPRPPGPMHRKWDQRKKLRELRKDRTSLSVDSRVSAFADSQNEDLRDLGPRRREFNACRY